jgi:hypothetical protein
MMLKPWGGGDEALLPTDTGGSISQTILSRKFVFYGRYRKHGTYICTCVSGCHRGERRAVVVFLIELIRARKTDLLSARQSFGHDTSVPPCPSPLPAFC